MEHIGEGLKKIEANIALSTNDPVLQHGFTQVPNAILKDKNLSIGGKVVYSMFLHYAWNNSYCFPGQDRLAEDIGLSRSRVTEYVTELKKAGLIEIQRRGLGKTNIYTVNFRVENKKVKKNA